MDSMTKVKVEIDVAADEVPTSLPSSEKHDDGVMHWTENSHVNLCLPSDVIVKVEPVSTADAETGVNCHSSENNGGQFRNRPLTCSPVSEMGGNEPRRNTTEEREFEINFKTEPITETRTEGEPETIPWERLVVATDMLVKQSLFCSVAKSDGCESIPEPQDDCSKGVCSASLKNTTGTAHYHDYVNDGVTHVKNEHGTEAGDIEDVQPNSVDNDRQEVKHKTDKPYSCSECPSTFHCPSHLKRHQLSHDLNAERPFSCTTCKARFKLRCHLKQHTLTHTGERPFSCKECSATFARSDHLKQHTQSHLGLRPYLCTVCHWSFTQAAHLRKHMVRHRDDRVVCCKIKTCKAVFTSVNEFESHRLTHVEDRKCKVCNVVLSRADDMKKHMRIHTKDKPYSCSVCSARFTQPGHLSTHKLQHTGVKPFSCEQCGSNFTQSHHLKRHMEVHEGEGPFSCKLCSASFKRSSSLTRHKQKCRRHLWHEVKS